MAQGTATDLECRLAQAERELSDALERQAASDEVLRIISSSPGVLEPIFQAILEKATRICEARFGILYLREGDAYRLGALYGAPPAFAEASWREPVVQPGPRTVLPPRSRELTLAIPVIAMKCSAALQFPRAARNQVRGH